MTRLSKGEVSVMGEAVPALANGVCFDERYSALAVVLKEGLPPMPAATPSRRSPTLMGVNRVQRPPRGR